MTIQDEFKGTVKFWFKNDINITKLEKEVSADRVLGPFAKIPMDSFRTSGLGAIPKKNGKWRMILHLSAPYGENVNDGID